MSARRGCLKLFGGLLCVVLVGIGSSHSAAPTNLPAEKQALVDRHGDALPAGARQRLGTVRFRREATSLAYSPDGKLLAAGGADNRIYLLDAASGKEVRRLAGHQARSFHPPQDRKSAFDALVGSVGEGDVTTVAFSPDSKTLASGGWDQMIRLWDVATGQEIRRFAGHGKGLVATVAFSPDGKYLASRGGNDGVVRLWDVAAGQSLFQLDKVQRINPWRFNRDTALAFAPDGKTLTVGDAKLIQFLSVPTGKVSTKLTAHLVCTSLAYSADGKLLASGGVDGHDKHSLRIWDVEKGQELRRCALPKDEPPISIAFAPDGKQLAAVIEEDDLRVFDTATGKPLHRLKQYWASRLAYAPDGKTLAAVRGATIRRWDPATGAERGLEMEGHQAGVSVVAQTLDGKLIVSGGENIRLWDSAAGKQVRAIAASGAVLALSPDGAKLASTGRDRLIHLWDAVSGKEIGQLKGHAHPVKGIAFSPDGKMLASGDVQATVRIWELATGKALHVFDLKSLVENLSFAFSPDGKTLACAGAWNDSSFLPKDKTFNIQGVELTRKEGYLVLLWDTATGQEVRRLGGLRDKIKSVAFSPDGKKLAATSRDGRICLWDAASGKELLFVLAHPTHKDATFAASPSIAFSPDGKTIASGSTDKTIRLWDATTARELGRFEALGGIYALAFAADGKSLVSGGADTAVLVWDLTRPLTQPGGPKENTIFIRD